MGKSINLYLDTSKGFLSIPFTSLKDADCFTMEFDSREDFLSSLIKILELPIGINDVKNMYLSYKYRRVLDYEECMPVMYAGDNYNFDSLIECYAEYLKQDQNRLMGYGIVNATKYVVPDFVPGRVSNYEINKIVMAYLKKDYRKRRDTYFLLKYEDFNVRIDKVASGKNKSDTSDLSKLESTTDGYIQYLIELSSRSEEDFERAMDELSMMDLDEIRENLDKTYYGVVDGVSEQGLVNPEEVSLLVECTGKSLDILKELVNGQLNNGRRK